MRTAREEYAEAHAEYMKAMHDLFIDNIELYRKINTPAVRAFQCAFEFGVESAKESLSAGS